MYIQDERRITNIGEPQLCPEISDFKNCGVALSLRPFNSPMTCNIIKKKPKNNNQFFFQIDHLNFKKQKICR